MGPPHSRESEDLLEKSRDRSEKIHNSKGICGKVRRLCLLDGAICFISSEVLSRVDPIDACFFKSGSSSPGRTHKNISDEMVRDRLIDLDVKGARDNFRKWQSLASDGVNDGTSTSAAIRIRKASCRAFGFKDLDTFIDLAWSFDHSSARSRCYVPHGQRIEKPYRQSGGKPAS